MDPRPHALSSYLPRLLLERIAGGPPVARPEARLMPAAILLSDIQGFTALVESFSQSGRAGLEELTWLLNGYFIDLCEIVYSHGGDVLYIAGDAFVCHWGAATASELERSVQRAAQAGLAIQARLHDRGAGRGHRFRTRVGVAAGPVCMALVGGTGGRWELIASGAALHEAAAAESACAAGEVLLSASAWALLSRHCRGEAVDGGTRLLSVDAAEAVQPAAPPTVAPDDAARLRPFVPPSVLDRLAWSSEWLAERRHVTVLMADLPALDDDEASLQRTHRGVQVFQQVVERFEGTLRVDVDDKGIMVLAVFGLPPRAHEDDARRAVHAAQQLERQLAEQGLQCGIGIASGRAFCGAFGNDLRREYLLRGDVINLAARLMRASATQVVCDEATQQALRGAFDLQELPAQGVKGRSAPVRAFRPLAPREGVEMQHQPIVGRSAERELLKSKLDALLQSQASALVVVSAEAGMGKSSLMAELRQRALDADVRVLAAAAGAIEATTGYHAWQPVFGALFGHAGLGSTDAARVVAEHMQALPEWARQAPLLGEVLRLPLPDSALTAGMSGDVRADNTRRLIAALLQREVAARPTLLLVEDAQWLDSSSWALLHEVLDTVRPLLTVVTTRPQDAAVHADYARLLRQDGVESVTLESLSAAHTTELIAQRLGVVDPPASLVKAVRERAMGHPFFCEELLRSLVESGVVKITDGRCEVGELGGAALPTSVEGVVLSRIDRLSPGQNLSLKVASVVGLSFRQRTLADTHPEPDERPRVPAHLEALTTLGLTLPQQPPPQSSFQFKHAITRDVAYDLMPLAQRRPVHDAVAQWFETHHADELPAHAAVLAHHWSRAAQPAKTVEYAEMAGQQALRSGAFTEALLFFQQAIEVERGGRLAVATERRALWDKGLGTAHYFLGDMQRARQHLERAASLLDRPLPAAGFARVRGVLGAALRQSTHRLWPARFLGRDAARRAPLDEAADCYRTLGQIYYLEGEASEALVYVTVRGVNVGERAGPSPALARNLSNMGTLCGFMGRPGWARWYAQRAIEMAEREGQHSAAAYVWSINSLTEAQNGHWAAARHANSEALRYVLELGDHNLEAEIRVIRSTLNLCEGDYLAAPEAWGRARELAQRSGNQQVLCWSLLDEVDTLLGRGRTDDAALALEHALAVPTAASDGSSAIDKLRATAVTRCRQGRWTEAVQAAQGVIDMVTRQPPTGYHWVDFAASATEVLLDVLAEGGEHTRANRAGLLRQAERASTALLKFARIFGNVRARSVLMQGLLCRRQGRDERALAHFGRALALARKMDMPYEAARAQLEIGRLSQGAERESVLDQARQTLRRLGADHFAQVAEDALAVR